MHATRPLSKIRQLAGVVVIADFTSKLLADAAFAGRTTGLIVPVTNPQFSLGIAGASFPVMLALMTA